MTAWPTGAGPERLPRAVLFDWDNTLIDSWECIRASVNATLVAMGHAPWTIEQAKARVRRSLRDSFPELFGDRWEEAGAIFYEHFAARHLDHLRPLPGAQSLIRTLAERGVYLGVVSNKKGALLRREAAALGWQDLFGELVGAGDAEADKPDSAPVRRALAPGRVAAGPDVWFVGDADIDMACAHASGCVPVLVCADLDAAGRENDFVRFPPAHAFDGCDAVCDLVRRLSGPISR